MLQYQDKKFKKYYLVDLFIHHIPVFIHHIPVFIHHIQSFVLMVLTGGAEFTVWQNGTIDFLLVDWKLTVFSFIFHGSFVLEYADSFNQRDFVLHGSLVLQICPIKSTVKNLRNKSKFFFLQSFSLFPRSFVFSLLIDGTLPEAILRTIGSEIFFYVVFRSIWDGKCDS